MKIMQGDSYPIPVDITQDGMAVTPEMVDEVEITVGSDVRKTYSSGGVYYDDGQWYFRLSQEETFQMDGEEVILRIKYPRGDVLGARIGIINASEIQQKVVL